MQIVENVFTLVLPRPPSLVEYQLGWPIAWDSTQKIQKQSASGCETAAEGCKVSSVVQAQRGRGGWGCGDDAG